MTPIAAIPVMLWALADGTGGFVASGDSGQWQWGLPTSGPGGFDAVWATRLDGDYLNDATDHLEIPVPDVSGLAYPVLTLRHWYVIQPGDLGVVEVDGGAGWVTVDPIFGYPGVGGFSGDSLGWQITSVDLGGFGPTPRVRLTFQSDPAVSAAGWYVSDVGLYDGDVTAPRLVPVLTPVDTEQVGVGQAVELAVQDDVAVLSVELRASINGGSEQAVPMAALGGGSYRGLLPGAPAGSVVAWYAVADDGEQVGRFPDAGSETYRVILPAPTDLRTVAEGRVVGDEIELAWAAPVSSHEVLSYRVDAVDGAGNEGPWVVFDAAASVPLRPDGARTFEVHAVFDVGIGEPSAPLTVSAEVPELVALAPAMAFQGDTVRIRVRGHDLYLTQDAAALDLGAGVVVEELTVVDVDEAVAVVSIEPDSAPGPRDAVVASTWGSFRTEAAFVVVDGASAPRIVSVAPERLRQGETATVTIDASQVLAGPVTVDPGEGLLVVADPLVDGARVTVELVVAGDAAPGLHTLVLDDGARLWTADLLVDERVFAAQTGCRGCDAAPGGGPLAAVALAGLLVRRRRLAR